MQDSAPPDNLLPRVANGDRDAVQGCIDRYSGLVWSLARRLCPNHTDAEDAVQDIFVSLWRSADRFNPEMGSEPTFVAMIARRRLIDRIRRVTRGPAQISLDASESPTTGRSAAPPEPASNGGDTDSIAGLTVGEESSAAKRALDQLSDDQQRVIRMSVLHGLSHEKISVATDMPLGTVKTHIRRGLIKVRQILAEQRPEQRPEQRAEHQADQRADQHGRAQQRGGDDLGADSRSQEVAS